MLGHCRIRCQIYTLELQTRHQMYLWSLKRRAYVGLWMLDSPLQSNCSTGCPVERWLYCPNGFAHDLNCPDLWHQWFLLSPESHLYLSPHECYPQQTSLGYLCSFPSSAVFFNMPSWVILTQCTSTRTLSPVVAPPFHLCARFTWSPAC